MQQQVFNGGEIRFLREGVYRRSGNAPNNHGIVSIFQRGKHIFVKNRLPEIGGVVIYREIQMSVPSLIPLFIREVIQQGNSNSDNCSFSAIRSTCRPLTILNVEKLL